MAFQDRNKIEDFSADTLDLSQGRHAVLTSSQPLAAGANNRCRLIMRLP
jgi:hypothetical protein